MSPILICKSLFGNGQKLLSQNTHYFVLFQSQRNLSQIVQLASQLGMTKSIKRAYQKVLEGEPFQYIFIDIHPSSLLSPKFMIRSNIMPDQNTMVYD